MSFQINRTNPPARCEICHQTDSFDPATGVCDRCIGFYKRRNLQSIPGRPDPPVQERYHRTANGVRVETVEPARRQPVSIDAQSFIDSSEDDLSQVLTTRTVSNRQLITILKKELDQTRKVLTETEEAFFFQRKISHIFTVLFILMAIVCTFTLWTLYNQPIQDYSRPDDRPIAPSRPTKQPDNYPFNPFIFPR